MKVVDIDNYNTIFLNITMHVKGLMTVSNTKEMDIDSYNID